MGFLRGIETLIFFTLFATLEGVGISLEIAMRRVWGRVAFPAPHPIYFLKTHPLIKPHRRWSGLGRGGVQRGVLSPSPPIYLIYNNFYLKNKYITIEYDIIYKVVNNSKKL